MKNIHVIPTDKPSRLFKVSGELKLTRNFDFYNGSEYQNIYITSDEEIKEEDWCLDIFLKSVFQANSIMGVKTQNTSKKIILTTDLDLIKDGVEVIDNEFLEWFVKNPSCEEVEIEEICPLTCCIQKEGKTKMNNGCMERNRCLNYKIIIPQEEPCSFCNGTGQIVSSTKISGFKTCDCINIPQEEPKQTDEKGNPLTFWGGLKKHKKESIEEEAELFAKSRVELDPIYANGLYYGFIQCGMSKWFEAEKIKAQIEENLSVLEMLKIHGTESSVFRVKMRIEQLEKALKIDDNGVD
jgi:hypothetical protein